MADKMDVETTSAPTSAPLLTASSTGNGPALVPPKRTRKMLFDDEGGDSIEELDVKPPKKVAKVDATPAKEKAQVKKEVVEESPKRVKAEKPSAKDAPRVLLLPTRPRPAPSSVYSLSSASGILYMNLKRFFIYFFAARSDATLPAHAPPPFLLHSLIFPGQSGKAEAH